MIRIYLILTLLSLSSFNLMAQSQLDEYLQRYLKTFRIDHLEKLEGYNKDLYKLGEKLFFDNKLSGNQNISCASCHHPHHGSVDLLPLSVGEGATGMGPHRRQASGILLPRKAPHLFNLGRAENKVMFWDGRVRQYSNGEFSTPSKYLNGADPERWDIVEVIDSALAAQALFPMLSNEEMLGRVGSNPIANLSNDSEKWDALAQRFFYGSEASEYQQLMLMAYPDYNQQEWNIGHIAQAIAHFEAHRFDTYDTPLNRFAGGDLDAMSYEQKRGAEIFFNKARCATCHNGPLLTNHTFHNVVVPQVGPGKDNQQNDLGMYHATGRENHKYLFKVPGLINVAKHPPYMHDGAFVTLEEVIEHYDTPFRSLDNYVMTNVSNHYGDRYSESLSMLKNPYILIAKKQTKSPGLATRLDLTEQEKKFLLIFLKEALTSY